MSKRKIFEITPNDNELLIQARINAEVAPLLERIAALEAALESTVENCEHFREQPHDVMRGGVIYIKMLAENALKKAGDNG